jgi:hypothetical protein
VTRIRRSGWSYATDGSGTDQPGATEEGLEFVEMKDCRGQPARSSSAAQCLLAYESGRGGVTHAGACRDALLLVSGSPWKNVRMRSPQTLSEAGRRIVAVWAADCAERVVGLFEVEASRHGDGYPPERTDVAIWRRPDRC